MSQPKDKDRILAQIKAFTPIAEIEGLSKHLHDLENDGYVKVERSSRLEPYLIRLTASGKSFLESGGYMARDKRNRTRNAKKTLLRIVEKVAIALISGYCGWLLRGFIPENNTAPSSPEPAQPYSLSADSIRLSSASQRLLNDESVPSRAKSRTVISDSSASTRRTLSIGTPDKDMSAAHSSNFDESKAMPSGK